MRVQPQYRTRKIHIRINGRMCILRAKKVEFLVHNPRVVNLPPMSRRPKGVALRHWNHN